MLNNSTAILEVIGKPGISNYGVIVPSLFGRTKLQLHPTRVVEKTQLIITRRHCTMLLSKIDSVEIVETGNSLWLVLGFMTLSMFIGVIFFVLYFVIKNKYLVLRSESNVQVVMLNAANTATAEQFLDALLQRSEDCQSKQN
jgi:hypothetical protein